MKVKALRNKTTGKFLHYERSEFSGNGWISDNNLPDIQDGDIKLEELLDKFAISGSNIDSIDYELIEFELIETGVVGADIRNKLSPIKNLIALIGVYLLEKSAGKKILMKGLLDRDIKQARISLEYLTKMFN